MTDGIDSAAGPAAMNLDEELAIECDPQEGTWRCLVSVGSDPGATRHDVLVDRETLADLAPGAEPEELVRASFQFLLEREPREAIMRSFELPIIGRFFSDYADVIRERFSTRPG